MNSAVLEILRATLQSSVSPSSLHNERPGEFQGSASQAVLAQPPSLPNAGMIAVPGNVHGVDDNEGAGLDKAMMEHLALQRIIRLFELTHAPPRVIIGEYSCWLMRNVLLKGRLFILDNHVCFVGFLPADQEQSKTPRLSGFLSKKGTIGAWSSYWFILQGNTLRYFHDAKDTYCPVDSLPLQQVQLVELSASNPTRLKLRLRSGATWRLSTDSPQAQKEWFRALQEASFCANNTEADVRLVLPTANITRVERIPEDRGLCLVMDDSAPKNRLSLRDPADQQDSDTVVEEYVFAFFANDTRVFNDVKSVAYRAEALMVDSPSDLLMRCSSMSPTRSRSQVRRLTAAMSRLTSKITSSDLASPAPMRLSRSQTVESPASGRPPSLSGDRSVPDIRVHSPPPAQSPHRPTSGSPDGPIDDHTSLDSPSASAPRGLGVLRKLGHRRSMSDKLRAALPATLSGQLSRSRHLGNGVKSDGEEEVSAPRTVRASTHSDSVVYLSPPIPAPAPGAVNRADSGTSLGFSPVCNPPSGSMRHKRGHRKTASLDLGRAQLQPKDASPVEPTALSGALSGASGANEEQGEFEQLFQVRDTMLISANAYLVRTLPRYGRVYVGKRYLAFKSSLVGMRTTCVVPKEDIITVAKESTIFRNGFIVVARNGDLCFEFHSHGPMEEVFQLIQAMTEPGRRSSSTWSPKNMLHYAGILQDLHSSDENFKPVISNVLPQVAPAKDIITPEAPKPMHITVLTIGTRGDVQPFIALCKGLQGKGHRCRIATHLEYKKWIEGHGLEFREVKGEPAEIMQLCVDNGMFSISFIRQVFSKFRTWLDELLESTWTACHDTDLLIEAAGVLGAGFHIAEKMGIPLFRSFMMPWTRTSAFPHPFAPTHDSHMPRTYNSSSFTIIDQVIWAGTRHIINRWRRETLGLPSIWTLDPRHIPFLYGISPNVLPPPPDWPDWVHMCGYWFLDQPDLSWHPPQGLLSFLAVDPEVTVYIGFGSIVVPDPDEMSRVIVEAVKRAKVRAIVCRGWSDRMRRSSSPASETQTTACSEIFEIPAVPHDWLFKRVRGVVHHGGSGTTAAGLRAGVPCIIKPFFGDQFFWAARLQELGAGMLLKRLTVDKFSAQLRQLVTDIKMAERAKVAGERIRSEDGVETAIRAIYRDLEYTRSIFQSLSGAAAAGAAGGGTRARSPSDDGYDREEKEGGIAAEPNVIPSRGRASASFDTRAPEVAL